MRQAAFPVDPLVRDLVAHCAAAPRPLREIIEDWRTSCPRLTIWEDAIEPGFVERIPQAGGTWVSVTARGRAMLAASRQEPHSQAREDHFSPGDRPWNAVTAAASKARQHDPGGA